VSLILVTWYTSSASRGKGTGRQVVSPSSVASTYPSPSDTPHCAYSPMLPIFTRCVSRERSRRAKSTARFPTSLFSSVSRAEANDCMENGADGICARCTTVRGRVPLTSSSTHSTTPDSIPATSRRPVTRRSWRMRSLNGSTGIALSCPAAATRRRLLRSSTARIGSFVVMARWEVSAHPRYPSAPSTRMLTAPPLRVV
jgi:hypothetical protein